MRYFIIFLFLISLNAESFADFKANQLKEFQNYKKSLEEGFREYKKELNEGFKKYKQELSKYWANPILTTKKKFVEYSKDKKVRKVVNYEKSYIKVDVIAKNEKEAKQKIQKAIIDLSTETTNKAFNRNPVLKQVTNKLANKYKKVVALSKPTNELVVGDMLFKGKPTKVKINKLAQKIKTLPLKKKPAKVSNAYVYSVKLPIPPKNILIKAKNYKGDVFKRANQFNLTPSLIYAIIHTESTFNPMARSYIPAFGLMQIVPQTAGKDAYKMLYKKNRILSPEYLYNAHNNILIGSAYLYKIYYKYFKGIKNPVSRLYCTIAAYNTGVGNVACAFNSTSKDFRGRTLCYRQRGDYNIKKALPKINSMSSREVYNHLIKNLRYDEAKNYLKRVTKRYILYLHALRQKEL